MPPADFLPIEFVIIGGGIAGLTAALALSRIGHHVTLFDKGSDFHETALAGGCRLAPNVSKVLYRWGLEDDMKKCGVVPRSVHFVRYDTGRTTGDGEWEDEFQTESGGEFLLIPFTDLRRILHDHAVKHGTRVRADTKVVAIHVRPDRPSVKLASGEEVYADVVIGADGTPDSLSRRLLLGHQDEEVYKNVKMFNSTISAEKMRADPALASLINDNGEVMYIWSGDSYGAIGFPVTERGFSMHVYAPRDPRESVDKRLVGPQELLDALGSCEPRLRKLAESAHTIIAVPVTDKRHIEDWVHPDGPVAIIGEAAHPTTAGSLYALCLAAEDGMMLGRLFYHLHRRDQIPSFLSALSSKCLDRMVKVEQIQRVNPIALALPAGIEHARDLKATVNNLDRAATTTFAEEAIRSIFSYDPEEEADAWWMEWGLLQDRAAWTVPLSAAITVGIRP